MSAPSVTNLLSPRRAWETIGTAVLPHSLSLLDTLGRDPNFAAAVNGWIAFEARGTRMRETHLRTALRFSGRHTTADLRERREREQRRQRTVPLTGPGSNPRVARSPIQPHVFWHDSGAGPVLLLLNGWTAGGHVWPRRWLSILEQRFRVIRVDNRGTGLSRTAPAPFTMANLADDAADVLSAIGAEGATVLGVSMGAMIAQELALRHPELVERLILVASRPPSPAHILGAEQTMLAALGRPGAGQPLDEFYREVWTRYVAAGAAERESKLIDELVDQLAEWPTPRVMVINQLRAIAGWYGSRRLNAIEAPTIVVHGGADPLSPVGNGLRLAQLIPGASYVEFPEVGHLVQLEAGQALAAAIP